MHPLVEVALAVAIISGFAFVVFCWFAISAIISVLHGVQRIADAIHEIRVTLWQISCRVKEGWRPSAWDDDDPSEAWKNN